MKKTLLMKTIIVRELSIRGIMLMKTGRLLYLLAAPYPPTDE